MLLKLRFLLEISLVNIRVNRSPESEIGYIAIHFGGAMSRLQEQNQKKRCLLVCATGQGSAQLLKYKILSQFRDKLEIVGITGYYQLKVEDLL